MTVSLTNADNALKSFYLDAISSQLNNNTNPLLSRIKQCTNDVYGKEVRKLAIHGINGGIGAGDEDGYLPVSAGNNYVQMVSTLKNLYGTIEITDKAIRASQSNSGAFVNLLNAEMESLIKAGSFNFGRMLFGDGTGKLATVSSITNGVITLDSVRNLIEGMIIDFRDSTGDSLLGCCGIRIASVDRVNKTITLKNFTPTISDIPATSILTLQESYGKEITGLGAIFGSSATLYGLARATNGWLNPYKATNVGSITETKIQKALDTIEEQGGAPVNFIVCSWGVRRALQKLFSTNKRIVDTVDLDGGFKAISYNGIPIVADRFCPEGTMYLLNTNDFTLNQLCDWQWLSDDDGKVLKQISSQPIYTATLVKYAELICARPYGQGVMTGITEE